MKPQKEHRRRWIVWAMLGLSVAAVCVAPWAWHASRVRSVRAALAARNDALAIERLLPLVGDHPTDAELRFLLARAYRRLGRVDEMTTSLNRAKALGYPPEALRREWILAMARSGRMTEAQPELERLVMNPGDDGPEICEAFVAGYFQAYRIDDAMQLIEAWERDYPRDGQPHYYRGKFFEHAREWSDAVREFRRALELSPESHEIRRTLAQALVELNEFPKARIEFDRCLEEDVKDVGARIGLAKCLRAAGKKEDARRELLLALDLDPGALEATRLMGEIELESGNTAAALKHLRDVVSRNPRNPDFRYLLATALMAAGESNEARDQFRFVDKAKGAHAKMQNAMRLLMSPRSELKPDEILKLRFEVGSLALEYGEPADGVTWLNGVLEIDPNYAPAHKLLADHFAKSGDEAQAEVHRRKAGRKGPPDASRAGN